MSDRSIPDRDVVLRAVVLTATRSYLEYFLTRSYVVLPAVFLIATWSYLSLRGLTWSIPNRYVVLPAVSLEAAVAASGRVAERG